MSWKIYHDAIFEREFARLDDVIKEITRKDEISRIEFYPAEGRARQLLYKAYVVSDFWVADLIEGSDEVSRVDLVLQTADVIQKYAGKGILKKYLPSKWNKGIESSLKNLCIELRRFSVSAKQFANYVLGWSEMRLDDPIQEEVKKHRPECYAILFGWHGSVADITDDEYAACLKDVRMGKGMLHGMLDTYAKFFAAPDPWPWFDPISVEDFLRNYLPRDEFEWDDIYPKLQPGLKVLEEFMRKKAKALAEPRMATDLNFNRIIDEWKRDLSSFSLEALKNYGFNRKAREKLAGKYERGIEIIEV